MEELEMGHPYPALSDREALQTWRRQMGFTQGQLGQYLGVSGNTIGRWERGDMQIRSPKMVFAAMWGLNGLVDQLRPHGYDSKGSVYLIRNVWSGKVYIGFTKGHPHQRWARHVYDLATEQHASKELQEDWLLVGPLGFEFKILEQVNPEELSTKEAAWIRQFGEDGIDLYNVNHAKDLRQSGIARDDGKA